MEIRDFIIRFACPNRDCDIHFSKGVYGDGVDIEDLYEDHIAQFMMGECYRCHAAEIGVESITASLKRPENHVLFQITWSCKRCESCWIQNKHLTKSQVKDKDLIMKIREETECPNPGCDKSVKSYEVFGINMIES